MARNIFEVLIQQHNEVRQVLDELAASSQDDAEVRREMGAELVIDLISHNEAESQTLYRRLMEFEELRGHVEEHQAEHEQANQKLQALRDMDVEDEAWLEHLQKIQRAVEHHIADEESKLFPEARLYLDDKEAESLAQAFGQMQARRRQLLDAAWWRFGRPPSGLNTDLGLRAGGTE